MEISTVAIWRSIKLLSCNDSVRIFSSEEWLMEAIFECVKAKNKRNELDNALCSIHRSSFEMYSQFFFSPGPCWISIHLSPEDCGGSDLFMVDELFVCIEWSNSFSFATLRNGFDEQSNRQLRKNQSLNTLAMCLWFVDNRNSIDSKKDSPLHRHSFAANV